MPTGTSTCSKLPIVSASRRAAARPRVKRPRGTRSWAPRLRWTIWGAMRVWARRSSSASNTRARNTNRPPFPAAASRSDGSESWARGAPLIRVVLSVGASQDPFHGRKGRVSPVLAPPDHLVRGLEAQEGSLLVGLDPGGGGLSHLLEPVDHPH